MLCMDGCGLRQAFCVCGGELQPPLLWSLSLSSLIKSCLLSCSCYPPDHWQMVFEAIKTLKERNGSSIQAIKKSITATYPSLNFTPHQMRSALKKGVESGKFIKVRDKTADRWSTPATISLVLHLVLMQIHIIWLD